MARFMNTGIRKYGLITSTAPMVLARVYYGIILIVVEEELRILPW